VNGPTRRQDERAAGLEAVAPEQAPSASSTCLGNLDRGRYRTPTA
jgi:hypothetical protein